MSGEIIIDRDDNEMELDPEEMALLEEVEIDPRPARTSQVRRPHIQQQTVETMDAFMNPDKTSAPPQQHVNDEPIEIYNNGNHVRDFTYIDDVVEMILRVAYDYPFKSNDWDGKNPDSSSSSFPWRTFNIGNGNPQPLMSYIKEIEKQLGKEAKKIFLPMQAGDVPETSSDISKFRELYDYMPRVQIDEGVMNFISWYKEYNEKFPKN